ncbi:SGNH/GDSL hydrolase family protein [Metabacillus litoralis]|uniref:SGNH/GDSL hydrolase family protein n=1 Tax=Metabacillus litoralis TaxID=152268 RepID=A0A5C6W9L8_9BACI|nr:SGNH/GDSL hydrolase family protein [Metabacillus litoralis]TXC93190.1 SGNH/GDSL hydrolase family protein [Metabacillus litoralis]
MLRKLLIFSIVLTVISGCSSETSVNLEAKSVALKMKENPTDEFIPKTINLVGIGDSLTKGVGDEAKLGGYFGRVTEKLKQQDNIKDVKVKNFGVKGHKTTNLQKKLNDEEVIKGIKEADVIVMTIGGNDIMNVVRNNIFSLDFKPFREEQKKYKERFKSILATVRSYNASAKIVYIGLYNPFKYMLPEISEIDTIMEEWNNDSEEIILSDGNGVFVSVADIFSSTTNGKLLYKDEFHPNEVGYSLMADRIYNSLKYTELTTDSVSRKE